MFYLKNECTTIGAGKDVAIAWKNSAFDITVVATYLIIKDLVINET
jgi:hypothetical protein